MERYQVLKRIGVGTYGSAYLVAPRNGSAMQYVLKKVKLDASNEKEQTQAEMEVTLLAQLDHPLVLGYIDHFLYKNHLCIVTDYCEGGDLYQLLRARKAPLTEAAVLDMFVQIVLAIQYVHQQSILHRDLKTQNIFLTREGNVKLGDFGIARSLNSTLDLASTIIGTPYYMSPEVMSNLPYDYKSDMWSMGCVLYEMMSLKHAFDATDMSSLVLKIMRGEHLPIPQQFSPESKELVKQLLSKSPKQRPSPEQILKMPFLKDVVARTRDTVTALHAQQPRRRSMGAAAKQQSNSGGSGGSGGSGTDLDRELDAAKERLRRIQLERDALNKQVQNAQKEQASTTGRVGVAAASAAALGGRRAMLQPSRSDVVRSTPAAVAGAAAKALSHESSDTFSHITNPKARVAARKQEEIRQREAELLEARRSYFEERKQADVKLKQMYQPTGVAHSTGGAVALTNGSTRRTEQLPASYSSNSVTPPATARGGSTNLTIDSSDDEIEEQYRERGAAQELEAELSALSQSSEMMPLTTFNGGALGDKVKALRSICSSGLGAQLFELIHSFLRQRSAGGDGQRGRLNDDQVFQQELMTRLGSNRMQYVHLIDQLIYFEELAGCA